MTARWFRPWKIWLALRGAVLVLLVLWSAGYACFAHYTASLKPLPPTVNADAIVVLTGGAGRIDTGLDLLAAGAAGKMFVSGVGEKVTTAALLDGWQDGRGGGKAWPCCLTLGKEARNTAENALETREWAAAQNLHSVRLVTAAYHMPRAWLQFHHAMPDIDILPSPSPLVPGGFEARHITGLTLIEYNKTLFSWVALYLLPPDFFHA